MSPLAVSVIVRKDMNYFCANRYDVNVLNAKIEDPFDTNYRLAPLLSRPQPCFVTRRTHFSDDELMFLPYFTWAQATGFHPEQSIGGSTFLASVKRSCVSIP
jgi:hypothetical protein